MDVLLSEEITKSDIVSNNAPVRADGQVEWSNQAWPIGSVVTRTSTDRVYRAVYDVPVDSMPPEESVAFAQIPFWQDIGPMNQMAAFDGQLNTQTVGPANDNLTIVLHPGVITDVWLGNLSLVTSVQVIYKNKPGGEIVYDEERSTSQTVTNYWDWWFGPFNLFSDIVFTDIPAYLNGELTIIIKTGSTARVGMIAIGKTERLGYTLWDPETDYRNYSARRLDNTWGPSEGTGGMVTKDQRYTVLIDPDEAPRVSRFMNNAMRRPAVWIPHGDPKFEGIRGFGQAIGARMRYPDPGIVLLSIDTRGFI